MVDSLRAALAALYRLLPVHASESDLAETDEQTRKALPHNFAAIATNGFFFPTAGRIVAAGLLLTWFVSELTPSAFWVSIIIPIQYGLALIAQPWIAEWLSGKRRRGRFYTYQALLRGVVWVTLGISSIILNESSPALLLVIFFAVIVVDAVAAGVGNIAFSDTLAQAIPKALRGRVRGWRGVFGGIITAFVGIWIQTSFSEESGIRAYGLLFIAAGIFYAIGGLVFGLIEVREADAEKEHDPQLGSIISRIRELWQQDEFRRFVLAQSLITPIVQGLPFFTLFAKQRFGLEIDALGALLIVSAVTPIIANFVWGRLADRLGNRQVLIASAAVGFAAPICAALLFTTETASGWVIALLGVVVFAINTASAGFDLTTKNYILELSPSEEERPFYIGVNDTLVGIPTTLLAAAGFIIDAFGFVPVFVGVAAFTIGGILLTLKLPATEKMPQG